MSDDRQEVVDRVRAALAGAKTREQAEQAIRAMLDEYDTPERRLEEIADLAEAALHATEPRRAIWTDADYLVAILAMASRDGDRARRAAIAEFNRRPESER